MKANRFLIGVVLYHDKISADEKEYIRVTKEQHDRIIKFINSEEKAKEIITIKCDNAYFIRKDYFDLEWEILSKEQDK